MHDPEESHADNNDRSNNLSDEKRVRAALEKDKGEKSTKENENTAQQVRTVEPTEGDVDMVVDTTQGDGENTKEASEGKIVSEGDEELKETAQEEQETEIGDESMEKMDSDTVENDNAKGEMDTGDSKEVDAEMTHVPDNEVDSKKKGWEEQKESLEEAKETTEPKDAETRANGDAEHDDEHNGTTEAPKDVEMVFGSGNMAQEKKQESEGETMKIIVEKKGTAQPNDEKDARAVESPTKVDTPSEKKKPVTAPNSAPPVTAAPQPPVLRGTLSHNVDLRRHVIRGMWNYENSNTFPPQRFELIRNLEKDEDPKTLPKDGEFHGSFSLAYFHTTSKGKQKERSKVIPESGVNIKFTEFDDEDDKFKVDGKGTNQFGIFHINGTATRSPHAGEKSYDIVLRKRYEPSTMPATLAVGSTTAPASANSKTGKKRKHDHADMPGDADVDMDVADSEQTDGPRPPPSQTHALGVVSLRGKLYRQQSEDLGMTEVVHKINGMWSSGLDLILADPQNVRGLCNSFEYEHKSTYPNDKFPVSGRYSGWFDLSNPDNTKTRISEKDVTLKFRKNNAGYWNVEGRGSNVFGKYSITGTLTLDHIITIFRHFQVRKAKKSKAVLDNSQPVTSAPPPLHGPGRSKVAVAPAPPEPKLKSDDVEIPEDGGNPDSLEPIPPPAHGTYSAVSRGVMRLSDDGAHTCAGKWAMTREHYNNGQTSAFAFRLEPHFAAEAVAAMNKKKDDEGKVDGAEQTSASSAPASVSSEFPVDSAMYKGSFQLKKGSKYQKVIDQQLVLKFRKNSSGSYNVYGKGINNIGEFNLMGTLILSGKSSGHVELYRVYPTPPPPPPGQVSTARDGKMAAVGAQGKLGAFHKLPTKENTKSPSSFPAMPRPGLQRRESSRLVKLPSRLEDDDPQAQLTRIMDKCKQILSFVQEMDIATGAFFREPVDPMALRLPTYHTVIAEPMDLGTVQRKLDKGELTSPEEFGRLVRLVFENAMTFNVDPSNVVHQAGRNLLILFNQKFRDVERSVEQIRRVHKPSKAELEQKEKEEAKKAKRKGKEAKAKKSAKKQRLEEAQAMAAANASAMTAIVSAAPSNSSSSSSVTRSEFNLLLQMMQQLQGQVTQTYTLLANLSSSKEPDDAMSASAVSENESVFIPPSEVFSSRPAADKRKSSSKKKGDAGTTVTEKTFSMTGDEDKPLSLKEQEFLTETINLLPPERLPGVIQIIRESATHLNGDEDEIDLEIDQLDTSTQRKLQRYVLQYAKPPRRPKSRTKNTKGGKGDAKKPLSSVKKSETKSSTPKKAQSKSAPDSFFAFGGKGDSDSDSEEETSAIQGNGTTKDQFNLGAALHDEIDDDEDIGNGGIVANWDVSKTATPTSSKPDHDDAWGAAREDAAARKAREDARKAREEKILADAELAKSQRLADAAARGEEIRAAKLEEEGEKARLEEQHKKDTADAISAAREQHRAQVQNLEQTVYLDRDRDIMKQYEQSLLEQENGGGASPSSDFGF